MLVAERCRPEALPSGARAILAGGDHRRTALAIRALSRRFGSREVVQRLDLELRAGERVALRGPNGSGKTTVIRCAAGTLAPSGGRIEVAGHVSGTRDARRASGVTLSQERSFDQRLSGRDNLLFFAQLRAASRRKAIELVDAVESELQLGEIASERVDRCSAGMLQQLAFARALLGDPPVLLLDEPTRSLDRAAVERFWAALDRRSSVAVLLATHRAEDAARCDRSAVLPA